MKFIEFLDTLPELKDFSVEIDLDSGEKMLVENIEWKKWSLRLLQRFLDWKSVSTSKFPLEKFYEYYEEWKEDTLWKHKTINMLYKYNEEWGIIRKV